MTIQNQEAFNPGSHTSSPGIIFLWKTGGLSFSPSSPNSQEGVNAPRKQLLGNLEKCCLLTWEVPKTLKEVVENDFVVKKAWVQNQALPPSSSTALASYLLGCSKALVFPSEKWGVIIKTKWNYMYIKHLAKPPDIARRLKMTYYYWPSEEDSCLCLMRPPDHAGIMMGTGEERAPHSVIPACHKARIQLGLDMTEVSAVLDPSTTRIHSDKGIFSGSLSLVKVVFILYTKR